VNLGPFQREYSDSDGRTTTYEQQSGYEFNSGTLTQTDVDNLQRIWSGELTRTDTALFSADTFRTVIIALESLTDVQLVSNPTVVTTNNSAATINIGEEYPIPSYTYNDERGTFEIQNFEFKNIGINLAVTPQINSAGFINLNIKPEISTRTGEVEFGGASGATIPIITTRKTESSVTIKSGYTLAIGGLIETRDEMSSSKVPLLGDIPGLKRMFSSETKQMERRNLIVFITAKILSASGATYRDVFSQHTLHEMGIKARDLPGFEPPPAEKELFDAIQAARDEIERIELEGRLQEQLDDLNEVKEKEAEKVEKQRRKQGGGE
jgi:type IV pilus assembly protein PilQ